jgi:hypothetical protein
MRWKVVIVLLILALGGYAAYRYLTDREQRTDFCARLHQCSPSASFADEFGSVETCAESEEGAEAMALFEGCDRSAECREWIRCGYGLDRRLTDSNLDKPKTNFEEVLPHL